LFGNETFPVTTEINFFPAALHTVPMEKKANQNREAMKLTAVF
jgi:hypothetical protein